MLVDETNRTFVTRWLDKVSSDHASRPKVISIDGVVLDSISLCALSSDGESLAPTKMSVRELRAELAARQYPLRGNKKELVKQLQVRYNFSVPLHTTVDFATMSMILFSSCLAESSH